MFHKICYSNFQMFFWEEWYRVQSDNVQILLRLLFTSGFCISVVQFKTIVTRDFLHKHNNFYHFFLYSTYAFAQILLLVLQNLTFLVEIPTLFSLFVKLMVLKWAKSESSGSRCVPSRVFPQVTISLGPTVFRSQLTLFPNFLLGFRRSFVRLLGAFVLILEDQNHIFQKI